MAIVLTLSAGTVRGENFSSSGYNVPAAIDILVSADVAKIARSDVAVKELFMAYSVGFAMVLTSKWSEDWPTGSDTVMISKMRDFALGGSTEARVILVKGTRDAEIFIARNGRQSAAARRVLTVLKSLTIA
ncbi:MULTISPECIES: hypothetical protein [Bosea]|uniref:hypothetical protein n=1 Tax=Bosea TaxID=85413 RepID=UPI0012E31900|nr:hypothetical protein [Bosea vaviloviae]